MIAMVFNTLKNNVLKYTYIFLLLLHSQQVLATALFNHIIQPYVSSEITYDANFLKLSKNPPPDITGNKTIRDSFTKKVLAGVGAKWQFGQQHIILDASANQNWFSSFSELNYTGYNVLGELEWKIGQKLSGELIYNQLFQMADYQQINAFVNNLERRKTYVANTNYEFMPHWFLRAKLMRIDTHYPVEDRQISNSIEDTKEFGIRYFNDDDDVQENMFAAYITILNGKFPDRTDPDIINTLDNQYTRTTYWLDSMWNYSVKTRFRGQVGYTQQRFKHVSSRNFSDIVSRADILWQPTEKTKFYLEAWREIENADDLSASFILVRGIKLTPTWTWSENPKIQVELPMYYENQIFLGTTGFNNSNAGNNTLRGESSVARLNLNYTPIKNVEMSLFAAYEHRHSNSPLHTYQDQYVGFNMKLSF